MKISLLATLLAALVPAIAGAAPQNYRIEHMDPPSWWAGMHNSKLQLMVHGPRIADLEPALSYPGVRIASVSRVENRNYLFIDLEIAPEAAPGKLELTFRRGAHSISYGYQLQAREKGSARRAGFNNGDVIYQVMPDRFANGDPANDNVDGYADKLNRADGGGRHGGDIQGIIDHLDYVAGLGFTQLWSTPLLESNMPAFSYHGYAATDHYRIDPRYGSNEAYRKLSAQARARGIGIIQDVVLNHIGGKHWWMQDMPMPDWLTYQGKHVPTAHHRVAVQDPYASEEDKRNFTQGWFSPGMPDLNQANPYVANYLIQNSIWWIEYAGLSGLRVDTYGYSDNAFLSRWSGAVMAEYPSLNLVGEEWSPLIPVVAHWQRGKQNIDGYVSHMPSMMDFPLNDALRRALVATDDSEQGLNALYETVSMDYLYPNASNLVLFEGNHDLSRTFSALEEDPDLFRMALAFVSTMPRIPQFYSGTEIQMTSTVKGRDDASYRRDFPGGWAGDRINAFTGAGLTPRQADAQAYVRKLLNWRKTATVIHNGKLMHYGPEQHTYVYFRYGEGKKVMVALNKNKTDIALPTARFHEMLSGVRSGVDVISGQRVSLDGQIKLPARSALILEIEQ
ncbi:glycosidase [Duganella sp. SG902]|uniref:glycoside hydrolase family 13 protein n=1 Tax=Duganella sp. SG902 TaxID=2587016 RepID=UPI00159E1CB2|nr:glycoside hydrolase family 13 protein [Duganella sp. SG902]NVM75239.1 glycosidase [Duganella sp. SG902]